MLIKKNNQSSGFFKTITNKSSSFSKKKVMVLLLVFIVFFASTLGSAYYGASLYREHRSTSIIEMVKGIIKVNLQIPLNYLEGLKSDPRVIIIDMKNNDYQKLAYLRKEALNAESIIIGESFKSEEVSGKIRIFGEENSKKAKFSLTGQNFDHINQPNKWSLRVKVKGDSVIANMKKFTLLIPETRARGTLSEWLNHKLEKHIGLISLRYEFVRVILNGKDLGLYALEEHFDKRLLENNNHREGLIVQAAHNGGLKVYGSNKVQENPILSENWTHLQNLWSGFRTGDIPAGSIFSIEELAKYYAMADIIDGQHTHFIENEFFYFNPITRLLQPIGREWDSPTGKEANLFIENLNPSAKKGSGSPSKEFSFHVQVFNDPSFVTLYFKELKTMGTKTFMDSFLKSISSDLKETRGILYSDYPYFDLSTDYLYSRIDYINKTFNTDYSQKVSVYFNEADNSLTINNKTLLPINITGLITDATLLKLEKTVNSGMTTTILVKEAISSDKLNIQFSITGIKDGYISKVFPWPKKTAGMINEFPIKSNYANDNLKINKNKITLLPENGIIKVHKNLVIPKGYSLIVKAGSKIDITNKAMILSYSPVLFNGTKEAPIFVTSSDNSGAGIAVIKAKGSSKVSYTSFDKLSSIRTPTWSLSAAVLFYESEVDFNNSTFSNNNSEDSLNIVRSKFNISNSTFQNIKSDAFDSDFSQGTVSNTKFIESGNDAIDFSGSKVTMNKILISHAGDKGISIGEGSEVKGDNIIIRKSAIALTAKDNSYFEFSDLLIEDSEVGVALYQKKPEFGPAKGIISTFRINNSIKKYLIQRKSSLIINDIIMEGDLKNVEELLYGNIYGRATIKNKP